MKQLLIRQSMSLSNNIGTIARIGCSATCLDTTPWTLVSNTAIAVNPSVTYVAAEVTHEEKTEVLVIAEPLLEKLQGEVKILKKISGKDLERTTYSRPFNYVEIPDSHFVVLQIM